MVKFLFAYAGYDRGSVFLWMPPEFADDEPEVHKLARSFGEFLFPLQRRG